MSSAVGSAGSNPPAGGSSANAPATNPPAGGSQDQTPAPRDAAGQPASHAGSNPPAGGSNGADDNTPRPDVTAEWKRENAALRKRLEALEAEKKAAEDAKLSEDERKARRIAELEREVYDRDLQAQRFELEKAVMAEASAFRLHDVNAAVTLIRTMYGNDLNYSDDGKLTNARLLVDRLVREHPFMQRPDAPQVQTPSSGRVASPPRPNPPPASPPQQPKKPSEMARLSDVPWTRPSQ